MALRFVIMVAAALLALWIPRDKSSTFDRESPSGHLRLVVERSDRLDMGLSKVRLVRDGKRQFEQDLPVALVEAAVTNEGYCVGYGNTDRRWGKGEFVVTVLAPDGTMIMEERIKRSGSLGPSGASRPDPKGLLIDPGGKWFAVRVMDPEGKLGELWWRYAIGGPSQRQVIAPAKAMNTEKGLKYQVEQVQVLPDTPWILVHFLRIDSRRGWSERPVLGGAFALLDTAGAVQWRVVLPNDYTVAGDDAATKQIKRTVRRIGCILDVAVGGRFIVWHMRDRERVEYRAEVKSGTSSECSVWEVSREAFDPE